MTTRYCRSTDGNNADTGLTWALAKAALSSAIGSSSAGDIIYVSQAHTESLASSFSPSLASSGVAPVIICAVSDAAEPPTAVSTAPTITTTAGSITFNSVQNSYWYGINFVCSGSITALPAGNFIQTFDTCSFVFTPASAQSFTISGNVTLINCTVKFSNVGQTFLIGGRSRVVGGSVIAGGTTPTTAFKATSNQIGTFLVEGFDFSNWSSGFHLFDPQSVGNVSGIFRNCKLPSGWSGNLVNANLLGVNCFVDMINCSAGAVNYAYRRQVTYGQINHETTVKLAASDDTTTLSWKLVSTSAATFPVSTLNTQDIYKWNAAVGNPLTATVEVLTNNVTLKDDECWLEVTYLGSSGTPLGTFISDRKATPIATAANQTSSSAGWTTTGLATPIKQKLQVTFTPQMVGYVTARVCLAKASTTVYVDPVLTLS